MLSKGTLICSNYDNDISFYPKWLVFDLIKNLTSSQFSIQIPQMYLFLFSLEDRSSQVETERTSIMKERDNLKTQLNHLQGKNTDEIYAAQVKEV